MTFSGSMIPFNMPPLVGREEEYVSKAITSRKLSGDGPYTRKCQSLMEKKFSAKKILLTTSCTSALDMSSILLNLKKGDEVIVSPYTFSSTVTSICLQGAIPKFVDIRPDTLNIDHDKIEEQIDDNTKAICAMHYAGVACEMDTISRIAHDNGLLVIEDAAQGINAKYKDRYLGTIGNIGAYSFHETKNYVCGEGGAIVLNDNQFIERAEIIREKGTDRSKFYRGEIDKYTWVDIGSSYLPSDMLAAYLYAQLENMDMVLNKRKGIYDSYLEGLSVLQDKGLCKLPFIPDNCSSNYHMFYMLLNSEKERNSLIDYLKKEGIHSVFHYMPLHLSPMGTKIGYKQGDFPITERISRNLVRLPMFYDLTQSQVEYITNAVIRFFGRNT